MNQPSLIVDVLVLLDLKEGDVIDVLVLYVPMVVLLKIKQLVHHVIVKITGLVTSVQCANLNVLMVDNVMRKLVNVNALTSGEETTVKFVIMKILTCAMNVLTMVS